MHKNIGYHTRLFEHNSTKVCGGSFGGQMDMETVDRLVKSHFKVVIKNSGNGVFVDKEGREVSLYITVDPLKTVAGKEAKAKHNEKERERISKLEKEESQKMEIIEELMEKMTIEEIIEKLKK